MEGASVLAAMAQLVRDAISPPAREVLPWTAQLFPQHMERTGREMKTRSQGPLEADQCSAVKHSLQVFELGNISIATEF